MEPFAYCSLPGTDTSLARISPTPRYLTTLSGISKWMVTRLVTRSISRRTLDKLQGHPHASLTLVVTKTRTLLSITSLTHSLMSNTQKEDNCESWSRVSCVGITVNSYMYSHYHTQYSRVQYSHHHTVRHKSWSLERLKGGTFQEGQRVMIANT